jgi:hypothetical protein
MTILSTSSKVIWSMSASTTPEIPAPSKSNKSEKTYDLRKGLFDFYSSQAMAVLQQYESIGHLLGPTSHWTAPGTLCEVLLRDIIRRMLPSSYSVDKGFIFGRRTVDGKEVHSPEIDILIHDSSQYSPVYRLDDFVIVQPAAVRGVIQVKRTLNACQLDAAIKNLVEAKEHLKAFGSILIPYKDYDIFSAAVFFGDTLKLDNEKISNSYSTSIRKLIVTDAMMRPHFLGSLENRFYVVPFESKGRYAGSWSKQIEGNVALIILLGYLTHYILPIYSTLTLYRPASLADDDVIDLDGSSNPVPS